MATMHVVVFLNGEALNICPNEVTLKGGKDRMQVHNNTGRQLLWTVGTGAFTADKPFEKEIAPFDSSERPTARKLGRKTSFTYTIIEVTALRGKKCRRARSKGVKSDPVLIID